MADDVWTSLVKGSLAFTQSRASQLVDDAFKDTGSLVSAVFDGSPEGTAKERLDTLSTDVKNLSATAQPLIDRVKPEATKAKDAVTAMAAELSKTPFRMEEAARAATELGKVLQALDRALDAIAEEIAAPSPPDQRAQIERDIKGIREPWVRPFRGLAAGSTQVFDLVCREVLGVQNGGARLADLLAWDDAQKRISMKLGAAGEQAVGALKFDGATIEAFFAFKTDAVLGVVLKTKLKAGLRSDELLQKIIPGQATTADTTETAVTLDTLKGLTFGNGESRVTLPVRFAFPGIELRQFVIALPTREEDRAEGKVDVMMTVAAKFGEAVGLVAEGAGVTVRLNPAGGGSFTIGPRLPDGVGMRIDAGVVKGGGYLRRKETEFGGVLDLQFTKIGITAIGLLGTQPFSLVIVMGVRFAPKIELGYGFTLNGLGGILAIERRLDAEALRKGLKTGIVGNLLFPDDPVTAAPRILDQLGEVFPPQPGAFVVGPMAQLGWGSQAGFIKAKVGIMLSLPDPRIVLLGAVEIAIPSTELPDAAKIVQLKADIYGEFTPQYLLMLIALRDSKLAGIPISGDVGLLVRWTGQPAFALSVGGFFPKYKAPVELADLRRIALDLSPGNAKWLKVRGEAYVALTANTIQFGGAITLKAELSVASASAWLSLDALFQWSPRFYFIVLIKAGIEVKAFGATVAGVRFSGELQGTTPWRIEGYASVSILCWDVDVEIGPHEWGRKDATIGVQLSPVAVVAQALRADAAWEALMPPATDTLARLVRDDVTPLLVHPLSSLQLRQQQVPLETEIDRIGSASVTARRVHLADPRVGSDAAGAVAHAYDMFAPGQFLDMTQDQQAARPDFERFSSGMQVAASREAQFAEAAAAAVPYQWETVYPHETFAHGLTAIDFAQIADLAKHTFNTSAVAAAARARRNPYEAPPSLVAERITVQDFGLVAIRRAEDLTHAAGLAGTMTTTAAARQVEQAGRTDHLTLVVAGVEP
jgi:hypothetical protein